MLTVFKSCSFLSPHRFDEIVQVGIPTGALDHLGRLAETNNIEVTQQLLSFARAYDSLQKSIQFDFPDDDVSYDDYEQFDIDGQVKQALRLCPKLHPHPQNKHCRLHFDPRLQLQLRARRILIQSFRRAKAVCGARTESCADMGCTHQHTEISAQLTKWR